MAFDAFYNLKEKKKKSILDSISLCLKSKNYDDLSVNDISVAADISRGSFYNYFKDKSDAVITLIDSRIREYFDLYMDSIKNSDYSLVEGTRNIYLEIRDLLKNEINALKMKNLKFFMEFVIESIHADKFKNDIDDIIEWLIKNTKEGQNKLNSYKKMANVLDMLIMIVLNTVFINVAFTSEYFDKYDDFNYKLDIIGNNIK